MAHALRKVLFCEEESIYGVLGRMHVLARYYKSSERFRLHRAFLETYALVTQEVALRAARGEFRRPRILEKVDVHFARLYFTPMLCYLEKRKLTSPWQECIRYTKKGESAFIALLLGINAHINADLCSTLVDLEYRERADFLKINKILSSLIPRIMSDLVFEDHDLLGLGALLFKRLTHTEFRKIIVTWRSDAWDNALILRKHPSLRRELYKQTEENARKLLEAFEHVLTPHVMFRALHKCRVRLIAP